MDMKHMRRIIFITILLAVFLSSVFLAYHHISDIPQIDEVKLKPAENPDPISFDNDELEPETMEQPPTHSVADPVVESKTEDEPDTWPQDSEDNSPVISNQMTLLGQLRRTNSETFITREDLPEDLRQKLDKAMEDYQRDGYFEIEETDIEVMNTPFNEVQAFELDDPALTITAEKIENTSLAEMEYIGVIPERITDLEDAPVPVIRRVFKDEAGYVSLLEADLSTSEALLQKEFVNKSIKGYPATQITYCAPSMRCVTQLSWLTNDKRYELSLRGDINDLGEDGLVKIASSLDLPPTPQTQNAE